MKADTDPLGTRAENPQGPALLAAPGGAAAPPDFCKTNNPSEFKLLSLGERKASSHPK